ncbi:MAG: hypothetical protein IPP73_05035 [Chitinophagaceae bacterium]|nr:hypothetical protein [Chitinophagaceae bacterium]
MKEENSLLCKLSPSAARKELRQEISLSKIVMNDQDQMGGVDTPGMDELGEPGNFAITLPLNLKRQNQPNP